MISSIEYFAPKTIEDALSLLSKYKEDSRLIAGGESLLLLMRQELVAPKYLIDIKGVASLDYIKYDVNEGISIGALTTHRSIEKSPVIRDRFTVLSDVEKELGSIEIRNWGTIGGNLCEANPADDPPLALIVLEGKVKVVSLRAERTIAVENFFEGYRKPALQADELLAEIQIPNPPAHMGAAFDKFVLIEHDMAIVSTAVAVTLDSNNNICRGARIALGAVAPVPIRAYHAERLLVGNTVTDKLLEEVSQAASEEASPISDLRASEEYRRELIKVLVKQVTREALERAESA